MQASVDGHNGNFILDTGAPGIVLDAKSGAFEATQQGNSVSGNLMVGQVEIEKFQFGIIKKERAKGNLLDVHHLELACGMDLMGLIGYEVLSNYELVFDFPNNNIQILPSGTFSVTKGEPSAVVPFLLCGHVPVVVAKVGGKRVFLGLDSGAEVNLIDKKFYNKIKSAARTNEAEEYLTGLDNKPQQVVAANVDETRLNGENFSQMRYVFTDLGQLRKNFDVPIGGLLGVPFFKDKVISIDYASKRVFIWD